MTTTAGPDYRKVIDLIRDRITSGEWPADTMIPSTTELRELTGLSITSVRRAVDQLQKDGILIGHPGKGVFVLALPEDADRERVNTEMIGKRLEELKEQVADYPDLRARVGRMEAILVDLHLRLGYPNPFEGEHDGAEKAPRRGRAGRR